MLLVLFSSPRNSDHTAAGLRFVSGISRDRDVSVLLMQDAVLLALRGNESAILSFGEIAEGYVLGEHLAKRGFGSESLRPPFKPMNYDQAVEMLMSDEVSVVGSF